MKVAIQMAKKALKLAGQYHPEKLISYQQQLQEIRSNKLMLRINEYRTSINEHPFLKYSQLKYPHFLFNLQIYN